MHVFSAAISRWFVTCRLRIEVVRMKPVFMWRRIKRRAKRRWWIEEGEGGEGREKIDIVVRRTIRRDNQMHINVAWWVGGWASGE